MPLVEQTQRKLLFEEAARLGITDFEFKQASVIYRELLGPTDVGQMRYGLPTAPIYKAVAGSPIDIKRISKYYQGLSRDLTTSSIATQILEEALAATRQETWYRTEMLKNRASAIGSRIEAEEARVRLRGTWSFDESFTSLNNIDATRSTMWIDTSEGVATLPAAGLEQAVPPSSIHVTSQSTPSRTSSTGTRAEEVFDGDPGSGWSVLFPIPGVPASCTAELGSPRSITGVTIDPLGIGVDLLLELDSGLGFKKVVQGLVYSKTTYPVAQKKVARVRISFTPATNSYPKAVGLREVLLLSVPSSQSGQLYSTVFKPSIGFADVYIDVKGRLPGGSSVKAYSSFASGGPWSTLENQKWTSMGARMLRNVSFNLSQAISSSTYRGLNAYNQNLLGSPSASLSDGTLTYGIEQVEVRAFEYDWASIGAAPHTLIPLDFDRPRVKRTWANVPNLSVTNTLALKSYAGSEPTTANYVRGAKILAWRKISSRQSEAPYGEMLYLALGGDKTKNPMQMGHNYMFRYFVYCSEDFEIQSAKYWFLQGFRQVGARTYRESGKSYGSMSIHVNGNIVVGSAEPHTLYDDDTIEDGGSTGRSFVLSMVKGWNTLEVCISLIDPTSDPDVYQSDPLDSGDPLLQLIITPSLFDTQFRDEYKITEVASSKPQAPTSEFDLLWNLPRDPGFWAWAEDRQAVLFNSSKLPQVDGYFIGTSPLCRLEYRSTQDIANDLYVRLDASRDEQAEASLVLSGYRITTR